nr:hypothetical protein [Tanacetum cinerariifolium]
MPAQAHLATTNYNPQLASAHNTHPVTTSQQYPIGLPGPTGFYSTSTVRHAQPHQPVLPSYPTSPAYLPQATMLPQAFQTMTLQEPNWNMDTGALSHLAENTSEFLTLASQVSSVQEKLKTLDSLPSILHKVTDTLTRFATMVENASGATSLNVPSAGKTVASPAEGEKNTKDVDTNLKDELVDLLGENVVT